MGGGAWCIACTKVRRFPAWSFKNHNIIYNKSPRTVTNLRCELDTECTWGRGEGVTSAPDCGVNMFLSYIFLDCLSAGARKISMHRGIATPPPPVQKR